MGKESCLYDKAHARHVHGPEFNLQAPHDPHASSERSPQKGYSLGVTSMQGWDDGMLSSEVREIPILRRVPQLAGSLRV